ILITVVLSFLLNVGIASNTPACRPINVTIAAEKEDCLVCMPITTTICSGYCETRGKNGEKHMLLKDERIVFNQRVCTYREVRYETTLLRGCPAGVDPIFTYPVAVSCHCDLCKVASSDCTVQGTGLKAYCDLLCSDSV
uniref:Glycoprotein hormone subunit beta domain-containing protein n=1 Tax=Podarcis muralis TaxID=64176 RepID=A0A670J891_PODMU